MAVGDDDTALASGSEIDVVGAGSADQDQFQLWAGGDALRVDRRLVADRDPRTVQPRGDFLRLAGGMQLQLVEGGAQGEHKMARGFLPVATRSAHWLAHPSFADAVERFLERERQGIDAYMDELNERNPFAGARAYRE